MQSLIRTLPYSQAVRGPNYHAKVTTDYFIISKSFVLYPFSQPCRYSVNTIDSRWIHWGGKIWFVNLIKYILHSSASLNKEPEEISLG